MLNKLLLLVAVMGLVGATTISCSEDIPDCPSKMCILAGGWRLTEVYIDGAKETGDLSKYRLELHTPNPTTATVSGFDRTQPSGAEDAGSWSVVNDDTVLRLIPDDNVALTEDWVIEKFTPRVLTLIIHRDTGIKDGPSEIEFVLEPF